MCVCVCCMRGEIRFEEMFCQKCALFVSLRREAIALSNYAIWNNIDMSAQSGERKIKRKRKQTKLVWRVRFSIRLSVVFFRAFSSLITIEYLNWPTKWWAENLANRIGQWKRRSKCQPPTNHINSYVQLQRSRRMHLSIG